MRKVKWWNLQGKCQPELETRSPDFWLIKWLRGIYAASPPAPWMYAFEGKSLNDLCLYFLLCLSYCTYSRCVNLNFSIRRVFLEVSCALETRGGSFDHFFPLLLLTTLMDLGRISEIRLQMISQIPWAWAINCPGIIWEPSFYSDYNLIGSV